MPLLLLIALVSVQAGAADGPLGKFGWFAEVVGSCWAGTFPDGKTRHTHCYTSQFEQFIRGTATLTGDRKGKMETVFSGDSLYAWNPASSRIEFYIWGSDGSHARHEAYYENGELVFPIRSRADPAKVASRSVWRRLGDGSFEVRREVPEGAGWKTELTVVYRKAN